MPYQIQITVKNVEDLRNLGNSVSKLIEQLIGQQPSIQISDKRKDMQKAKQTFDDINNKIQKR